MDNRIVLLLGDRCLRTGIGHAPIGTGFFLRTASPRYSLRRIFMIMRSSRTVERSGMTFPNSTRMVFSSAALRDTCLIKGGNLAFTWQSVRSKDELQLVLW